MRGEQQAGSSRPQRGDFHQPIKAWRARSSQVEFFEPCERTATQMKQNPTRGISCMRCSLPSSMDLRGASRTSPRAASDGSVTEPCAVHDA